MTLNIIRQLMVVISFLSAISASVSIDHSDKAIEEVFKVIVTVAGVEGNCGKEIKNNSSIQVRYI